MSKKHKNFEKNYISSYITRKLPNTFKNTKTK